MRKYLLFFVLTVFFSGMAFSSVYYDIEATDSDTVQVNTTVTLQCSTNCPVNRWRLNWTRPEGSNLVEIRDSLGPIEDYRLIDGKVSIKTNSGPERHNETVKMVFDMERDREHIYGGLYKDQLSLAGFNGRKTTGVVEAENLLSGKTSFGFDTSFDGDKMYFRGSGPVIIRYKSGEGRNTDYFSFFGNYRGNATEAYEIPVGTLGIYQEFDRFPVAVLPDKEYNSSINSWSAGEYVSGSMHVRDSLGEDFLPVLAHEVVHGLNDRKLKWDSTRTSYIDEGVAEHVESLVRKKKGLRNSNLFGEKLSYKERVNGTLYRFERESKGNKEALWNYYQEDEEFMKDWNAFDSSEENRGFGYAYSELIIKNYLVNNNQSLRDVYRRIDVDEEIEDNEKKWSIYTDYFDMTPCKFESRERFDTCLEKVNEYKYPVYSGVPQRDDSVLQVKEVEVPDRTDLKGQVKPYRSVRTVLTDFTDFLLEIFRGLTASS